MDNTSLQIGIDLGTSSCKVVAVDTTGSVVAVASRDYPLHSAHPGWSEQEPEQWWRATDECVREVIAALPAAGSEVVAIGLSAQMHGLVALAADHTVVRRAILWNDQRCERECELITRAVGGPQAVIDAIDNRMITGFTAGKIAWVRDHEPTAFASIAHVLNPKDYLRWRMNAQFVTDVSDASGTGLFDVRKKQWSQVMIDAVGLDARALPSVVESGSPTGTLRPELARAWNISPDVEVYGGGGDAVIQTASMAITGPGDIGVTLGTAGIIAAASDFCPDNTAGSVQVSCYNLPDRWHVMGVSLSAAGGMQWLSSALRTVPGADSMSVGELVELASTAPIGSDGLLFLPFLAGERAPHYAPSASAAWVGLGNRHGLAHMARSVIEGALLNMREIVETFREMGISCDRIIASGGATRHPFWLRTMADVFGISVVTTTGGAEGGAYGAAVIAGIGCGTWGSADEAFNHVKVLSTYRPDTHAHHTYEAVFSGHRRLHAHFVDVYDDIERARAV
ncbi:xylulokinase [Rhodococcus sp. BP-349]|uniref:xylulokinase n=1 Tax=unclassified Rhodococcus (in: high G+C Gram-positive bacteria) TaxID=192944 RepID=UPI001C9B5F22|nr:MULTISPECIES: xylulokinase [unclassified Rhodococcus (in: high G+C Gram-positive bacteria)]MBY6537281.1 xylulokinase [Rhodococcus sp. BP-363]MBY6541618.1 xylulokinase [Rhodococcus sp. BP-369]MBY6560848.1 xylulokinase [Rhodococcus sp. BP-370]MBY6575140.1 xylulokinase [Rhodococcus sp. BP-364]MBY6584441.1 xylulokinase [Rhodococcus sp. BP-358]